MIYMKKKVLKNLIIRKNFFFNLSLTNKLNVYLRNKSYLYTYIVGTTTDPSKRYFQNILNFYKKKDLSEFNNYLKMLKDQSTKKNIDLKIVIFPTNIKLENAKMMICFHKKK